MVKLVTHEVLALAIIAHEQRIDCLRLDLDCRRKHKPRIEP